MLSLYSFGILTALLRRAHTGGFYTVNNSLLGTANFLRSLGRAPPSAFARVLETREQLEARGGVQVFDEGFEGKRLESVRHAARFGAGAQVGWEWASRGYGDVEAAWLER